MISMLGGLRAALFLFLMVECFFVNLGCDKRKAIRNFSENAARMKSQPYKEL